MQARGPALESLYDAKMASTLPDATCDATDIVSHTSGSGTRSISAVAPEMSEVKSVLSHLT